MGVFEMVFAIVLVTVVAGVINNWVKSRNNVDRDELDSELATRLGQIEKLEKRMQVLERIVTDRQYDLKKELHDLESR